MIRKNRSVDLEILSSREKSGETGLYLSTLKDRDIDKDQIARIVQVPTFKNIPLIRNSSFPSVKCRKRMLFEGKGGNNSQITEKGNPTPERRKLVYFSPGKRKLSSVLLNSNQKKMKVGTSDCSQKQPDQKQVLGQTEFIKEGS